MSKLDDPKMQELIKKMAQGVVEKQNQIINDLYFNGIPVKVDESLPDSHPGYMIAHNLGVQGVQAIRPGAVVYAAPEEPSETMCDFIGHKWKLDYSSPFVKKDYHSCKRCGMKKEDYER